MHFRGRVQSTWLSKPATFHNEEVKGVMYTAAKCSRRTDVGNDDGVVKGRWDEKRMTGKKSKESRDSVSSV